MRVDAGGHALSSSASPASLVGMEVHVECATIYSHVWRVILTEPVSIADNELCSKLSSMYDILIAL